MSTLCRAEQEGQGAPETVRGRNGNQGLFLIPLTIIPLTHSAKHSPATFSCLIHLSASIHRISQGNYRILTHSQDWTGIKRWRTLGCAQIDAGFCLRHKGCAGQTVVNLVKTGTVGLDASQIICKYFKMNELQNYWLLDESNPVKLNQTDLVRSHTLAFSLTLAP